MYRGVSSFTFDEDQYDFNLEMQAPGEEMPTRVSSVSVEMVAGTEYTFVITERAGVIQPILLEQPSASSDLATSFIHAANSLSTVDVFIEAPGTDVTTAVPWGSASFRERLEPEPRTLSAGDYELTITNAGDPTTVLLASPTFTLADAQNVLFALVDGAHTGTAPASVIVTGALTEELVDRNLDANLRVINATAPANPIDVLVDSQLNPPLIAGLGFTAISADVALPPGERALTITPAGNPGVLEVDQQTVVMPAGRFSTVLVTGQPGAVSAGITLDDRRPVAGQATVTLYNGAAQFTGIDFFLVNPGTDITTVPALAVVGFPGFDTSQPLAPGSYELVLRENGTQNIVAGPLVVTLEDGGIHSLLATDGASTSTADVTFFDDFN